VGLDASSETARSVPYIDCASRFVLVVAGTLCPKHALGPAIGRLHNPTSRAEMIW
jgi:hypothetical protein